METRFQSQLNRREVLGGIKLIKLIPILLLSGLLLTSCGIFKRADVEPDSPEEFEQFYLRFHESPDFQMSRIDFPIEGKFVDGHSEYRWTEENWEVMKVPIWDINEPGIQTEYYQSETEFFQKIWVDNSGFMSEYRFELINSKWYLVYALEQNL
jgi:hypothetical protein